MASYSYTFQSGDGVTPTRLNDARTVSDIVNADISSTAGIVGSKISPTFTSQVTAPNGSAASPGIRLTTAATGLFGTTSLGLAANGIHAATVVAPDTGTNGTGIVLQTPAATDFAGIYNSAANSYTYISGSTGSSAGGQIRLYGNTHATKASFVELTSGNTVRMTVDGSGNIGIGTPSPSSRLHVVGQVTIADSAGNHIDLIGRASDDAAFVNFDDNAGAASGRLGMVAGSMRLITGGTAERMRITSTGLVDIGDTSPTYLLDVNGTVNTTDAYRVDGTKVVGNRATGWAAATGTATRTTFATSTVTTAQLAERVKALIDDLTTHGLIGN